MHAISRKIGYRHAVAVSDRTRETMLAFANRSMLEYTKRGFEVADIHADKEFECLREKFENVSLEICGPDEHVPEVEQTIRTMKETMRVTAHGLPYRRIPKLMVVELVAMATHCLNGFPRDDGVSDHMSPHSIVTGRAHMDYNKILLEFSSYVQLLDRSTNTIRFCTIGAIALNPMWDDTRTYRFMSLKTGQVLTKGPGSWTEVPITDIVIAQVEALAKQEGQPLLQDSNLLVEWRPSQPFDEDDEYDEDYEPSIEGDEDDLDLEVDDATEGDDDDGDGTQEFPVLDIPPAGPDPGLIPQPPGEDETSIEVGDEEGVEEVGSGT